MLPSRQVVADFTDQEAMQQVIAAAKYLCNKNAETKVTLHFDSTGRSRVDFPDENQMLMLRALFFAYKDREQITKLDLGTLNHLHFQCNREKSFKEVEELVTERLG